MWRVLAGMDLCPMAVELRWAGEAGTLRRVHSAAGAWDDSRVARLRLSCRCAPHFFQQANRTYATGASQLPDLPRRPVPRWRLPAVECAVCETCAMLSCWL